jgi:hypothetical protein
MKYLEKPHRSVSFFGLREFMERDPEAFHFCHFRRTEDTRDGREHKSKPLNKVPIMSSSSEDDSCSNSHTRKKRKRSVIRVKREKETFNGSTNQYKACDECKRIKKKCKRLQIASYIMHEFLKKLILFFNPILRL